MASGVGEIVEQLELTFVAGYMGMTTLENCLAVSARADTCTPYSPAIPSWEFAQMKCIHTIMPKDTYHKFQYNITHNHLNEKQPNCPSTVEWTNKRMNE